MDSSTDLQPITVRDVPERFVRNVLELDTAVGKGRNAATSRPFPFREENLSSIEIFQILSNLFVTKEI